MDDEKNDAIKDEPVETEEKDLPIPPENNAPSEPEQKDDSSPLTEAANSEAQQDAPVNAEASPLPDNSETKKAKPLSSLSTKKKKLLIIAAAIIVAVIVLFSSVCFHFSWDPATCTQPKTCTRCGLTEGEALGHKWSKATCTKAKKCKRCGKTDGEPLGHVEGKWKVKTEATCAKDGVKTTNCTRCNEALEQPIPKLEHKAGDWVTTKQPTASSEGTRTRSCTVCGTVLETENFKMSPEEIAATLKAECAAVSYDEVARNLDQYKDKKVKFTGEVIQVMEDSGIYTLRVNVTQTSWGYDDTIMVYYIASEGSPRILEDDVITLYGTMGGMTSYESVLGATITLPILYAQYIE